MNCEFQVPSTLLLDRALRLAWDQVDLLQPSDVTMLKLSMWYQMLEEVQVDSKGEEIYDYCAMAVVLLNKHVLHGSPFFKHH